ncbi:zinc finger CCCH domain-containing protein 32-like [Actinidia eriantha]|uniref:zinc finger CCCH domain-containing protein 32-like n=1 Tax=Actinidia eriantha TaxID=165200 RepID=UPI00258EB602|nr:zinc finger CCCH domain-containing protein 32-like [Actinidia eriantha]XP_057508988.1 zinc finger CCCH domain-containing protein 32-like [Actinidia eriantha]XP_057508989.1 zinc finger CCCH domain-containing protein 32-like [Actinidia eriantha]
MELYGRRTGLESDRPVGPETGLEESMRRFVFWGREFMYPERPGVPDCAYYMRTGSCGYGAKCRYNHPPDRSPVGGAVSFTSREYPERPGEPTCQYYSRTRTCKFGASCKFHHPKNDGGSMTNVPLNSYGYPLRPGEKECSYYLKTGQCKFGITCKFHHPQSGGMSMPEPARPFYPTVQPSSVPSTDQYRGISSGYQTARPLPLPGSYVQGAYGPLLLPPGVVPLPGWSPYSGPVSPALSPVAQPSVVAGSVYGVTQLSSSAPAFTGPYSSFPYPAGPSSSGQNERVFPERPGQPDCQYYLKTGDCKFGSSCRYHHPPDWVVSKTNCVLSHLGLPLRPGMQPCSFYLQNGYCKFGRTCKFDHPVGTIRYSPSASSLTDMPVAPYMIGSSLSSLAPSFSYSDLRPEFISVSQFDPHSSRMPSSGNTSSSSVGLIFSQTGSASVSDIQPSNQRSAPVNISISTRQGGDVRHSS